MFLVPGAGYNSENINAGTMMIPPPTPTQPLSMPVARPIINTVRII
jgi:hypothetical protein